MLVQNFQLQYEQKLRTPITDCLSSFYSASIEICMICICQEGPPLDKFEGTSALKKCMETKDRWLNQSAGKSYKPCAKENVIETLVDIPFNDDDNIFS